MASFVIDLQYGAVSEPLYSSGSQTNGDGSSKDLSAGILSTNFLLNVGTATGDATVKAQESDDGSSWSDISGASFSITGAGVSSNSVQVKRVLRSKRYVRGKVSGVTAAVNFALTAIAQKQYVFDPADATGNSGIATPVTAIGAVWAGVVAAVGLVFSPVGLTILAIAGLIAAFVALFSYMSGGSADTANDVNEANKSWVEKAIDWIQKVAKAFGEAFNWMMRQAAKTSDWIAEKLADAGEWLGILPEGTGKTIRQMDPIQPFQLDMSKVDLFFAKVKAGARAAGPMLKNLLGPIGDLLGELTNPSQPKGFTLRMERTAYVPKDLLLDKGQDVTVVGVLRVKVHPPAWVNGQFVPVWTEIWVEGVAVREEKE